MMKLRFLYLLAWAAGASLLSAQTYNFRQYGEEAGLKQLYVYHMSQSPRGYLTISSGEAITMFDGNSFTSVYDKSMKENIVTTHFTDWRNLTWLGHQQHGLSYIKNRLIKPFEDTLLADVKISQITSDMAHTVWLAGSNGIYSVDSNFVLKKLPLPEAKSFNCLAIDARQQVLAGAPDGLLVMSFTQPGKPGTVSDVPELKDKNVKQIMAADASGAAYWVLADDVVYGISLKDGRYALTSTLSVDTKGMSIACIYVDSDNSLWLSVFGDGLRRLSFTGKPVEGKYSLIAISRQNGLNSLNIQSIFQDNEGNMWFGTFGEGLIKKPLQMFSFYGKNEGIQPGDIKKVIADNDNLWMATDEGLAVFNRKTNSYQLYNSSNGFITAKITTLYKGDDNLLWIGTAENGVFRMNCRTKQFEDFSGRQKIKLAPVNYITKAGGKIMVATTDGIFVCNNNLTWSEQLSTNQGLLHNNVKHLFEDSKKRLWISSHGAPPYYIKAQEITSFKKIAGLGAYNITAVCEDGHGNIWIATDGDGVFKYDNKDFFNFTSVNSGLLSNYCYGIETDKNNSVWVTHRSGLSEMKDKLKKFTVFNIHSGLLFAENNLNAIYKDSASNLWLGTTQGIVAYNIETGHYIPEMPSIFIADIQLNDEYFDEHTAIEKKYGYYSVHIDYKAISLTESDAIYYRYRLKNVDSAWKITTMPYVDFPKLGDGDYVFEVMACNSNKGLCSTSPAVVTFVIQKPVWKHLWFYLLLLCLLVFVLYGIVVYRTRTLRKTQVMLEHKVEQKTFLLQREKEAVENIKTDLEHKNKDITDSIHYAKNIQDSLLPPDELMKDLFRNNSFVLYKPKDIVSGDFYWCAGNKVVNGNELCLAAVIDCTGHGVPGAFLSILANDFLKQTIAVKEVNTPNEILNYLNENISSHLNQDPSKNKIKDGMDVALVGINYTEKKLYYSGANNPIYIFRKAGEGLEEIIIKATKQAIGSASEVTREYELQIMDLQEGDTIYLFSDGYADQFGGERNKKITYKTFRAILSEAYHLPMYKQKTLIDERLEAWKNGTEQTDDVCVMGIRI